MVGRAKRRKIWLFQVLRQQAGKIHLAAHRVSRTELEIKKEQREAGQQDKEQRKPEKSARV